MNASEICSEKKCTGCMACKNACPRQCISMRTKEMGHWYPEVEQAKCIDCQLCKTVCPENKSHNLEKPLTAYAAWHTDRDEYLTSTSGGAAAALSRLIIERGGIVYGCVASSGLRVQHQRVDSLDGLYALKGSKYVQSDIADSYARVKEDLSSGKEVLFFGTPCQCAALRSFLRKEYDKLYRVDLICHGVPSQVLLRNHVREITNGKGYHVAFRKGNDMGLRVYNSENSEIYYSNVWYERYKDAYYGAFIDGYTYRDSCYQCSYACPERCSDITIGDFWGLGDDIPHDNVNGCSCILPITMKGLKLVTSATLELHERMVEEAVNGNAQLRAPKRKSCRISCFRKIYGMLGLKNAYRLCELDNIVNLRLICPISRRLRL